MKPDEILKLPFVSDAQISFRNNRDSWFWKLLMLWVEWHHTANRREEERKLQTQIGWRWRRERSTMPNAAMRKWRWPLLRLHHLFPVATLPPPFPLQLRSERVKEKPLFFTSGSIYQTVLAFFLTAVSQKSALQKQRTRNEDEIVDHWTIRSIVCSFAWPAHSFTCSALHALLARSAAVIRLLAQLLTRSHAHG